MLEQILCSLFLLTPTGQVSPPFEEGYLEIRGQEQDQGEIARSVGNLAAAYEAQGRYAEAESLYKRALSIWKDMKNPDYSDWGLMLGNFAHLCYEQERYAEAESLYKNALQVLEKGNSTKSRAAAYVTTELAMLYGRQMKLSEAEKYFKSALYIREELSDSPADDVDIALALRKLSALYFQKGNYADAEPLLQRALAITEKAWGPNHTNMLAILDQLVKTYFRSEKYDKAEPLVKRSLAIRETAFGSGSLPPELGRDLFYLAIIYRAQGKYAEAEPVLIRLLEIRELENSPNVSLVLNYIAILFEEQGRLDEANVYYLRALTRAEQALGPDDPRVADISGNYSDLLRKLNRDEEAEKYEARAKSIRAKQSP